MSLKRNGIDVDEIDGETLVLHENHTTVVFPASTEFTCVLTAHADAHTWTDWAEIADSDDPANTLSAVFASYAGHIAAMCVEEADEAGTRFMVEISHGASRVVISRNRVLTETNKLPTAQVERFRGALVPAGATVYYRAMCATAAAKTITVHFRCFLHV